MSAVKPVHCLWENIFIVQNTKCMEINDAFSAVFLDFNSFVGQLTKHLKMLLRKYLFITFILMWILQEEFISTEILYNLSECMLHK